MTKYEQIIRYHLGDDKLILLLGWRLGGEGGEGGSEFVNLSTE